MTLILALANKEHVIQISDRRLSSNGKLVDDESNKSAYLVTDDSQMIVGFTGLAEYGAFKAREWILDMLSKSKSSEIRKVFEEFRNNASKYFNTNYLLKSVPKKDKRLSVMFTGYVGPWLIGNCIVTNYQDFETRIDSTECFDEFRIHPLLCGRDKLDTATFVQRVGAWGAMTESDEQALRLMLIDKKPRRAIVNKAVSLVRKMSDRPKSGGTIGKQISSICLERGGESPISGYHTTELKSETYLSDMVDLRSYTPNIQISDIKIEVSGSPISTPKVGRNYPCPCGSGVKYKKCHGR